MKKYMIVLFALVIAGFVGCRWHPAAIRLCQLTGELTGNNHHGYKKAGLPADISSLSLEKLASLRYDNHAFQGDPLQEREDFRPVDWLETGKDPGLGVRELHESGIIGLGVSVAVIDKPIDPGHQEFAGRISYHQIVTDSAGVHNYRYHYHGAACASILCGKSCGVAPGARLYYLAVPDDTRDMYNYTLAIRELIRINDQLPPDEKIKAVSISHCVASIKNETQMSAWEAEVIDARRSGIAVIYSDLKKIHPVFTYGGCLPWLDTNDPDNFGYSSVAVNGRLGTEGKIILPADFRSWAGNRDESCYVYGGAGGFSWAIPYLTGLAALAWSIDRDLSVEEIIELIGKTKSITGDGRYVVNPGGLISSALQRIRTVRNPVSKAVLVPSGGSPGQNAS